MTRPILNLDELAFDIQTHGERFEARMAPVAGRIGAAKLGYRVTQLPPVKRAWPFHSHHANEEMIFVLEGRGRLRLADGEHPIRAGDFIAAPAGGVETAHQIINDSDQPLTYLCVSTMIEPEVVLTRIPASWARSPAPRRAGRGEGRADAVLVREDGGGVQVSSASASEMLSSSQMIMIHS